MAMQTLIKKKKKNHDETLKYERSQPTADCSKTNLQK